MVEEAGLELEKERRIGPYRVQERTARRLVMEAPAHPLLPVALMWGGFLPFAILVAPWLSGARLFVVLATALLLLVISALVVYFTPALRRIVVDLEVGEARVERHYLFPQRVQTLQVPLRAVTGVRLQRRTWQAAGEVAQAEWNVGLVGEDGTVWPLTEGTEEEPIGELARLVAEVAGRPLEA
jgi:hypothetical protein